MGLTLKNILINAAYYALTVGLLPLAVLGVEEALGVPRRAGLGLQISGAILAACGAVLQAWCIVLFQRIGGGTPSPVYPTRRLVDRGPYRRVRNPMNLGELLVFLGLAAWFGSVLLLGYTLAAWAAFHALIVISEEPRHARVFPDAYPAYTAATRRWLPMARRTSPRPD